ncbi:hypothetical protein AYR46_03050 [Sphingobium yanoikuyae]|uniref:hypothetical protein n=1 Tax=Sphingobium yanoikuyae TaxID=13690 RepID=UPI0007A76117|nr:hypothetical protein [Sphingobium yanoikuyae]KZC82897.1 hypothetical protein AYR46_03050 [Sphingobium yanoikuyae]
MDAQHLMNVLGMLRVLREIQNKQTATTVIKQWAGKDISDAAVLRVAAHISEEVMLAAATLEAAHLSDEVKAGIVPKVRRFADAFAINALATDLKQFCPDIPGMITTIAVVVEASGISPTPDPPSEVHDLIKDVLDLVGKLDGDLDPIVLFAIRQHAQILVAMLQNLKIFGVEIALSSYYELIRKVQRADEQASSTDRKKAKPLIERMTAWGAALKTIHEIWDNGTKVFGQAEKVITPLLTHLPK